MDDTKDDTKKDFERALKFKEQLYISIIDNNFSISYIEIYENERNYFVGKYPNQVPKFLKDCRTQNDFFVKLVEVVYDGFEPEYEFRELRKENAFINNQFNYFLDFLEFGNAKLAVEGGNINIRLKSNIFSEKVKKLLNEENYFEAVCEAYKIVREKLKKITGQEQAHKAFAKENYEKIFGSTTENDFFKGVKFSHMAIQNFRNENAHTPSKPLDKNRALHYITLASLAYDLIDNEKS